jgi:hypothetical protein
MRDLISPQLPYRAASIGPALGHTIPGNRTEVTA